MKNAKTSSGGKGKTSWCQRRKVFWQHVTQTIFYIKVLEEKCIFTKSNRILKEEMAQCNKCRTTKIIWRTCDTNEEA